MWRDEEEKQAGASPLNWASCSERTTTSRCSRGVIYLPLKGYLLQTIKTAPAPSQQLQVMIEIICSAHLITTSSRRHKLLVQNKTVNKGGDEGGAGGGERGPSSLMTMLMIVYRAVMMMMPSGDT